MEKEQLIKKILIGISIILIIIIIIQLVSKSFKDEPTKEKEELNQIVSHTSYDGNFTIDSPNNWVEVEKNSLNNNAIIELNNEEECSYVLVVVTKKENFDGDFSKYKDAVFKQKEEYYNTKFTSYTQTKIDGYDSEYGTVIYVDKVTGVDKYYIRVYVVETENYYGQIVIWTLEPNEEKMKDEFDSIAGSFKETLVVKEESAESKSEDK